MDDVSEPAPDPIGNGQREEPEEPCNKKAKVEEEEEEEVESEVELKRVAEIVLVLSTLVAMRGGRKPNDVEVELMREARLKLTNLCQRLAPKDIVSREAAGTVIEDLGLNAKVKDQRLGFRTPKISIAERYSHAKLKMEETNKFNAVPTTHTSQPLQPSTGGMVDTRVPTNAFALNKSSHTGTVVSIPPHISAATSAVLQYQSTGNEVRPPMVTGVMPGSHLGRSPVALPRVESPQFKIEGGLNGSPYVMQVQANSSSNHLMVNASTWSIQTQSAPSIRTRSASENKVPALNAAKVEGMADVILPKAGQQITTDQSFRPFVTQKAPGNLSSMHEPLQCVNMVQPPLVPSHADIAKIVQRLIQPKLPDHPRWAPPSRDYISKAFTCQMCDLTVNEVDSVLLCDACEKGFHLKCLQPSILRGIHNRNDWHCMRCLSLSGGKALPPKYGRVMRSSTTSPKLPSSTGVIQPYSERKAGGLDPKVSMQMLATNGNSVPTVLKENHVVELSFDPKTLDMRDTQDTNISSGIEAIDEKSDPNNCMKSASSTSTDLPGGSSDQQIDSKALTYKETSESETYKETSESKTLPISSEPEPAKCVKLQSSQDSQVELAMSLEHAEISLERDDSSSSIISKQKESHGGEKLTYDIKRDDIDVVQENFVGDSGSNTKGREHPVLSIDTSRIVEWVGDVVQLVDENKYYQSCCVDGVTYRLHSHALFLSSHGKLTPSKLQSMWEDCKTGIKWVKVAKCYFPDDLPGNIGHPCISEVNEVYESNSDRNEMASSIQGPCEVLPYDKFKQENDKRCQSASAGIHPIFLCRWFYDEIKTFFQPITS